MSKASEAVSRSQRLHNDTHAAKTRRYYQRHRDRIRAASKLRDPVKVRAQQLTNGAIRRGDLVRGECEIGGDCLGAIQAHHDDYTKPYEVRWFCRSHHQRMHRAERMAAA